MTCYELYLRWKTRFKENVKKTLKELFSYVL